MKKVFAIVLLALTVLPMFVGTVYASSETPAEELPLYAEIETVTVTKTEIVYSRGHGTSNYIFFELNGEGCKLEISDDEYALVKEGDVIRIFRTSGKNWELCKTHSSELYVVNLRNDGKKVYAELSDGSLVRVSRYYHPSVGEDVTIKDNGNIKGCSPVNDVIYIVVSILGILFLIGFVGLLFWSLTLA